MNKQDPRPKGYDKNRQFRMYTDMLLQANKDKEFVKRIIDPTIVPSLDRGNGSYSTHSMRHDVDASGQWYVYPSVVNQNGMLQDLGNKAFDSALNTGECIKVNDPKLAEYIATGGYKQTSTAHPSFKTNYNTGGQIQGPTLPIPFVKKQDNIPIWMKYRQENPVNITQRVNEVMKQDPSLSRAEVVRNMYREDLAQAKSKLQTKIGYNTGGTIEPSFNLRVLRINNR